MAFFATRVEDAFRALRRLTKGEKVTTEAESDIRWLERTIGLNRPLESYSARSQRRFKQRLQEGATSRKDIYRREYQARKTAKEDTLEEHGMTPSQWRVIEPLRDKLSSYGMDVDPYMDDEVLKDFATMYGYQYLRTVLTDQIDSVEQYLQGNIEPGNRRWTLRGTLEEQFAASVHITYIRGTDPYYYYHGRKA